MRSRLLLVVTALAACGTPPGDGAEAEVGTRADALGEPAVNYPNYGERAFHYLTNRARLAPTDADVCGKGFAVPVTQPLEYNLALNQVARYHSRQMQRSGCFQHASCGIPLGRGLNTCASARPPEQGGGCTTANESYCATDKGNACPQDSRLGTFYRFGLFGYTGSSKGENIAKGYSDERGAFCAFFLEGPEPAIPDGEEHGHFESIVNGTYNEVGHGVVARVYTQDFGGRSGIKPSIIPSASHWRRQVGSANVTFGAIWKHAAAPQAIDVVVEGACSPLSLEAGTPALGAYEVT
ncbi:MAG: CAP domain-containing protein, partial [Myxococcales bacterium]